MENNPKRNIYYTFCHIIFCFCSFFYLKNKTMKNSQLTDMLQVYFQCNTNRKNILQKVLLLLFSIVHLIFFEENISNNAILFIYFRG
jgi:hypothetical protein